MTRLSAKRNILHQSKSASRGKVTIYRQCSVCCARACVPACVRALIGTVLLDANVAGCCSVLLSIHVLYVLATGDDNVWCAKPSTRVICRLAQMFYCECWRSSTKLSVSRHVQCVNQLLCLSRPMHISGLQVQCQNLVS